MCALFNFGQSTSSWTNKLLINFGQSTNLFIYVIIYLSLNCAWEMMGGFAVHFVGDFIWERFLEFVKNLLCNYFSAIGGHGIQSIFFCGHCIFQNVPTIFNFPLWYAWQEPCEKNKNRSGVYTRLSQQPQAKLPCT